MALNNLPKIELKSSPEAEVGLFLKFLHHDFHKQQKNFILNSFPDLRDKLDNTEGEKEETIIEKFVLDFYEQNADKIKSIIEIDAQILTQKGDVILNALSDLMDADWSKRSTFYAAPTILPFSPFEENTFYYSILGKIRNRPTTKSVIFIAAHEISHFIFYDIMEDISRDNSLMLSKEGEHYLKEALVPAILNEDYLKNVLELENYSGNPELKDLYLKIDKGVISFVDFITHYYHENKIEKGEDFKDVLSDLVKMMIAIDSDLVSKKEIWNKYGMKMSDNPEALTNYKKPINFPVLK